jgi:AcrR family transcriptional regulator
MARWDPGAEDRLRKSALELYLERGFENVTVAEIAERAGLTRRTFFRYFADKREVLFAGSERLPAVVVEAVLAADAALPPFEAVLQALTFVGTQLAEQAPDAGERRRAIAASPELQERERTKLADLTTALAEALRRRGATDATAKLLAQIGIAIFQAAFERWIDRRGDAAFPACIREATAEVESGLSSIRA